jgi:hypothetical protein
MFCIHKSSRLQILNEFVHSALHKVLGRTALGIPAKTESALPQIGTAAATSVHVRLEPRKSVALNAEASNAFTLSLPPDPVLPDPGVHGKLDELE